MVGRKRKSISLSKCNMECVEELINEDQVSTLISQMSLSTATLEKLGIRYSIDTIITFIDDIESVRSTLENLYNEKIESQSLGLL